MSKRGNGEGTISKRSNGTYMGQVTIGRRPDGKPNRKTIYGKTRKEVADGIATILGDLQKGLPITTSDKLTIAEYLRRWFTDAAQPSVKVRTAESYRQIIDRHLVPTLGPIPLNKLSAADVQRLHTEKRQAGLSAGTITRIHAVLHRALRQAFQWQLVSRNVADLVSRPKQDHHEIRPLTPEEARAFLEEAKGTRHEALFVLALTSGMRQGELLGLRWSDVDLDTGRLSVRQTWDARSENPSFGTPKTRQSQRGVLLTAHTVSTLRSHRARQAAERLAAGPAWNDSGLVFCTTVGTPIDPHNLVRREFKPLLREAGLRSIRFHDLRHSTATLMLAQGAHPKVVSELLGHSQIRVTLDTYSHTLPALHEEAIGKLDRLLGAG